MKKLFLSVLTGLSLGAFAQPDAAPSFKVGNFNFTTVKDLETTPIANQYRSSTCWSYSSMSFLESELLRIGGAKVNLSEMFVVRKAYEGKAEKYVRMHGTQGFAPGGAFHDMLWVWKKYGLVPQSAYPVTQNYRADSLLPMHNEMDNSLKAYLDAIIKNSKLSNKWPAAVNGILDAYLGTDVKEFEYQGKKYTPESYAKSLGLNADDYISLTSFNHHPFYSQFALEIPDNWAAGTSYNLPLNEFQQVLQNAVKNGYSIAWGTDVGEPGFVFPNGIATVPEKDWSDMTKAEVDSFKKYPSPQMKINQEMRQEAFNNYETEDDHGMHITGMVTDQNGVIYYKVKNSWGTGRNNCGGYMYASEAYVLYKTTSILVHKNGIPAETRKKLGIN